MLLAALAQTPDRPEATPVGALSAQLRPLRPQSAMTAKRRLRPVASCSSLVIRGTACSGVMDPLRAGLISAQKRPPTPGRPVKRNPESGSGNRLEENTRPHVGDRLPSPLARFVDARPAGPPSRKPQMQ
jgi:hypothetical protein